jgi:hypothetical protein
LFPEIQSQVKEETIIADGARRIQEEIVFDIQDFSLPLCLGTRVHAIEAQAALSFTR